MITRSRSEFQLEMGLTPVQVDGSLDLEGLVDRLIAQGSTTTRADIMAVLEDSILACEGALQDGLRMLDPVPTV